MSDQPFDASSLDLLTGEAFLSQLLPMTASTSTQKILSDIQIPETPIESDDGSGSSDSSMDTDGKKTRETSRRTKLTPEGQSRMRVANSRYMSADYKGALQVLQEVVQLCPNAHEPYFMMAAICEETGDHDKVLPLYMTAAHLRKRDVELWKRLAVMLRDSNPSQSLYCIGKALTVNPDDEACMIEKAALLIDIGQLKKAIKAYESYLEKQPADLDIAAEVAQLCVRRDEHIHALTCYESSFLAYANSMLSGHGTIFIDQIWKLSLNDEQVRTFFGSLQFDHLNLLAELYIYAKRYGKIVSLVQDGARKMAELRSKSSDNSSSTNIIPIDLIVKLLIARIHIRQWISVQSLLRILKSKPIEHFADLYVDVGNAFFLEEKYQDAIDLYEEAIEANQSLSTIELCVRMAQCYYFIKDYETALECYASILESQPESTDVMRAMADIYDELGQIKTAERLRFDIRKLGRVATSKKSGNTNEKISQQIMEMKEKANVRNYHEFCEAYGENGPESDEDVERFLESGKALMTVFQNSDYLVPLRWRSNVTAYGSSSKDTKTSAQVIENTSEDESASEQPSISNLRMESTALGLTLQEWFDVNKKYISFLTHVAQDQITKGELKQQAKDTKLKEIYEYCQVLSRSRISALDMHHRFIIKLMTLSIALLADYTLVIGDICRWIIRSYPNSADVYRIYDTVNRSDKAITNSFSHSASQKFFLRLIRSGNADNPHLLCVYGFIMLHSRSYNIAVKYFFRAWQLCPNDPLINLSLGICHLHRSMQRKTDNRHTQIARSFSYLYRYLDIQKLSDAVEREQGLPHHYHEHEAHYNIGRAFQQIGLRVHAIECYEKALVTAPPPEHASFDLSNEARYNLAIMYQEVGARDMLYQTFSELKI